MLSIIPSDPNDPKYGALVRAFQNGEFDTDMIFVYLFYLLELLLVIGITLAFIMVIYGGYQYIIAFGDSSATKGKTTIKNALIGVIVSTSAYVIIDLILYLSTL